MHAMKAIAIIMILLLVVVNALELLAAASAFQCIYRVGPWR